MSAGGGDTRVEALLAALEDMAAGDLDRRIDVSGAHDEIDAIAHGVNVLAGELQFTAAGLQRARLDAEAANSAKTTFLRNVSHEIRTPLSAILALGERLAADGVSPERRAELIARILSNGRVLLALVDDLLDLAKVEAGRLEPASVATAPLAIVAEVVANLGIEAERKGVRLHVEPAAATPASIATDPKRLRQILTNLVGNAIKFTEQGTVGVRVALDAERLAIDVSDTGIGVTAAQAEALFAPFQQGDGSIAPRFGGSGLGLALSRRLAEGMGGTLELLHAAPGTGTTFRLVLPAPPAAAPPAPPSDAPARDGSSPEPPTRGRALAGLRLLLADDNRDIREPIKELLELYGAAVVEAEDGRTALTHARAGGFDLVLMDVRMPELDGLEATRQLRRAGVRVPVVALTADAVAEHREECLAAGCDGHLPKPVDLAHLVETVRALVGRR